MRLWGDVWTTLFSSGKRRGTVGPKKFIQLLVCVYVFAKIMTQTGFLAARRRAMLRRESSLHINLFSTKKKHSSLFFIFEETTYREGLRVEQTDCYWTLLFAISSGSWYILADRAVDSSKSATPLSLQRQPSCQRSVYWPFQTPELAPTEASPKWRIDRHP